MLKLILPDVGPMPQFTDWLSLTDEPLNAELVSRGHKPHPDFASAIFKLVLLERADIFKWLSAVAENHGPTDSDLSLLAPVITRRLAMGNEQYMQAAVRHLAQKRNEVKELEACLEKYDREMEELQRNRPGTAVNVDAVAPAAQVSESAASTESNGSDESGEVGDSVDGVELGESEPETS
ncbi:hypothetical protein DL98DRAFT_571085 [Cadophora sp. DSE1049]|nr:hypothetical protein DL98DRAFT_571085 [Cadophora sp. DSE1049]